MIYKAPGSIRLFFQNVKGLTYSTGVEDYKYYLSQMAAFSVDCFGLAETNTAWQHYYLQLHYRECVQRQFRVGKTVFGFPSREVDSCSEKETFQAGGCLTTVQGKTATTVHNQGIYDPTGLGRWSGITLEGKGGNVLSIITAYRVCEGSIRQAPIGSAVVREHEFYRNKGEKSPQPRQRFLSELRSVIDHLQHDGHAILLMLDANGTLANDTSLQDFRDWCGLVDLHSSAPAPSTYIGSMNRRIDYMLGCARVVESMTRQGSLAYTEGPQSDHRGLYVDLDIERLMGANATTSIERPSTRLLHSGNPELVATYLDGMRDYYADHRVSERIKKLYDEHDTMTQQQVRHQLTAWDNDQGRAMQHAEMKLKAPARQYQWSPKLRNAGVVLRYWKLRLRELKYDEDYSTTFTRWESEIKEYDHAFVLPEKDNSLSIEIVRVYLNKASKQLKKVQKQAMSHRQQSFQDLLSTYETDENPETRIESKRRAKIVKRTLTSEACRRLFQNIRSIIRPGEYCPLSTIKVPRSRSNDDATGPGEVHTVLRDVPPEELIWDTIITREEMENHLVHFNREAFRAASQSPCGHGVIHDALTFTSLSPEAEELLKGIVPPSWHGDDQLLKEFLASFAVPNTIQDKEQISVRISGDDIKKGFQGWKESTSTSPSGRHLGHYKALIQDPVMVDCLSKFLDIAVTRGISIPRWQHAVNVMIEKDAGDPKLNRLRIIHLFEADYNLFLKLTWGSRLVRRAVQLNLLNAGQHGSTPGKTTMEPIMLTQLTADMCRILKINYARFDNDASACFDRRIIVALGMLAARRCGMPINAIRAHAKSLELMQYMVKTVYGVSELSYRGTTFEPLFGTGQGSGASPAVWLSLVVVLLNTLEKVSPVRMRFASPDGLNVHSRLVDAFVDDTALGFTDEGEVSFDELVKRLEEVAQTWEKLLHYSGGALNLAKCSWFVMYWDWRAGRPVIRRCEESSASTVCLSQGESSSKVQIKRQELHKATRLLGVFQNPMGDFTEHVRVLKQKADQYSGQIKSPRLTAGDVRVFVRTTYEPAMRYSLPAMAIDEEELAAIQTRIIPAIVQKLGMSSKLPTAIRHGPISMGGLGLMDLRTENGIEMIKYFRHQVYCRTQVGELFIIQLKTLQLEAGIPQHLLEYPCIQIPYLTPTWVLSLRQFLSNHNLTISITDVLTLTQQGRHDEFIMSPDRLTNYTIRQQCDLNLVRIFLQCTTLSDMRDVGDDTRISTYALRGQRPPSFLAKAGWPRQVEPTLSQRRLWNRYISSQFLRYERFWRANPNDRLREIKARMVLEDSSREATKDLGSQILVLPRHQRRMLTHVHQCEDDDEVWTACRVKGTITIASDGGLKETRGTFGWTISTSDITTLYEGAGPVDGPRDVANSTRSEIAGLAAPLLLLTVLARHWGTRYKCKFRWICDSKSALANVNKHTHTHAGCNRQPANADLLSQIRSFKDELGIRVPQKWIKGHQQDRGTASQDVARNNRADELATWFRDQNKGGQSTEITAHVPEENISVRINGIRQVGQIEACIRFHINGYHLRCYLQSRNRWSNRVWNSIDLKVLGQFCRSLTPTTQIAQTKLMYDQRHTGDRRYQTAKIKDHSLRLCPCCLLVDETPDHVLHCKDNPGRQTALQNFRKAMDKLGAPMDTRTLKSQILQWLDEESQEVDRSMVLPLYYDYLDTAVQQQQEIGWSAAMKGIFAINWSELAAKPDNGKGDDHAAKGVQVMRKVLLAVHKLNVQLWTARNHHLHKSTSIVCRNLQTTDRVEIASLHAQAHLVNAGDRHFCERPLDELVNASSSVRRRWIHYMRKARARFELDGNKQTMMTDYFRNK